MRFTAANFLVFLAFPWNDYTHNPHSVMKHDLPSRLKICTSGCIWKLQEEQKSTLPWRQILM